MAGIYDSPYSKLYKSPYKNPYGKKTGATGDVTTKQIETMLKTLGKAGIEPEPVNKKTWLENLFELIGRPGEATTALVSAIGPNRTFGEAAKLAGRTLIGKEDYGARQLLEENFGKSDNWKRKVAEFGTGIALDPLTYVSLGTLAKPFVKGGANAARALGYGSKVEDVKNILSGVKSFFGYDDLARFAGHPEYIDKAGKVIKAVPDTREQMRTLMQLTGSGTSRTGFYIDKYAKENSGFLSMLKGLTEDEKFIIRKAMEPGKKKVAEKIALTPKLDLIVANFKEFNKRMGDELVKLGKIDQLSNKFTKAGLPIRIGGESSEGYLKHVLNKEWVKLFPKLEDVPTEIREMVRPYYQIGSKAIHHRKWDDTLEAINSFAKSSSLNKIGKEVALFEEDPLKIAIAQIEELSHIKSKSEIVDAIKALTDAGGKKMFQAFPDETIDQIAKGMITKVKDKAGGQPLAKFAGTDEFEKIKKYLADKFRPGETPAYNLSTKLAGTKGLEMITNPLFQEKGFVMGAAPEVAKIINKLSVDIPGESANSILRGFDKFTNLWKKLAITNPKFHIQNKFGALSNNMIDDAWGTMVNRKLKNEIMKGGSDKIYDLGALKGTADEIMEVFTKSGVAGGFTKVEATGGNILKKIDDFSRAKGEHIETNARLTSFINNLKKGKSVSEAVQKTFQIHGNYNPEAFSIFEKEIVKRVMPFYTWTKTSVPYQLQNFINKTGIYTGVGHLQEAVKGEEGGKELPEWLRERVLVGMQKTKDGKGVARQVPMSVPDLEMFNNPMRTLISKLNPVLKMGLELGTNKDSYFGNEVFEDNKYNNKGRKIGKVEQGADYFTSQIPALTWLKSSGVFQKDVPVVGKEGFAQAELKSLGLNENIITRLMAALAGQFDPTSPRTFDPERERYGQQSAQAEMLRNLIGQLRRAGVIPESK
jgi:hypothetical protein